MSALTRVQTALAPPPNTAGDADYAAQVEDDLNWLEKSPEGSENVSVRLDSQSQLDRISCT
jgi:hypothetical protein